MLPRVPLSAPKYTEQQREAVGSADRRLTAGEIAKRAARGELSLDGEPLEPFEIPKTTVGTFRARHRRRAAAEARASLADRAPRDAVEAMRRELVVITSAELSRLRRRQQRKNGGDIDGEQLRKLARAIREIASIPGPDGQPALGKQPGGTIDGSKPDGGATRDDLAGSVLAAAKPRGFEPVPSDPPPQGTDARIHATNVTHTDQPAPATSGTNDDAPRPAEDAQPGSFARAEIARLRGSDAGA